MAEVEIVRLAGFDTPGLEPLWTALLSAGGTNEIFLTYQWQRAWWESFGRGDLLLLLARVGGRDAAIAPLFADCGMIYFVGSGGSDYLDFVGTLDASGLLDAVLGAARDAVPGFVGFLFYHVPASSPTGAQLIEAAARLGLSHLVDGEQGAPAIELRSDGQAAPAAARKKSLIRHENRMLRDGEVALIAVEQPDPWLGQLFDQHIARWAATQTPSLFLDPAQRAFYGRMVEAIGGAGWLRFSALMWNGRPAALHLGFHYAGRYLWYKPSFDPGLATFSPGEVLLRRLLLAAIAEQAELFDFGLGDEAFKLRFATTRRSVANWGLYR